jgi:hypothetical protein
MATILLHEWQTLGSNLSPETGYFGFFKRKNTYENLTLGHK